MAVVANVSGLCAMMPPVGIIQRMFRGSADLTAASSDVTLWSPPSGIPGTPGVRSPWSTTDLSKIVWADLLGVDFNPVSRAEAMTIPSVAKARAVIVSGLAGVPLRQLNAAGILPDDAQPTWLYRTNGQTTPWHRCAWTLDDLLFYGYSVWQVVPGADKFPLDADRIPYDDWRVDGNGYIVWSRGIAQGQPIPNARVIPGPSEGLLAMAGRTIRAARNTEAAWAGRARSPIPTMEIHQNTPDSLTEAEIKELVDEYAKARLDPNGAVVFTPADVTLIPHGEAKADMLVEARNAVRLDVANFTGLPGSVLDGSLSTASLTYSTQEGRESEVGQALRYWGDPFTARLSQDDFVPRGNRVRFDVSEYFTPTPSPTGATELD